MFSLLLFFERTTHELFCSAFYLWNLPVSSILASLNLPAALEDSAGGALPQSLVEKSSAVVAAGGLSALNDQITELPELLQRNRDILDEASLILHLFQSL